MDEKEKKGNYITPGHEKTCDTGWSEIRDLETQILDQIHMKGFTLGNFGEDFKYDALQDEYAAHYSIPNPWAPAYLFESVFKEREHPLYNEIVALLLDILNRQFMGELELISFNAPGENHPFRIFWDMAPESLIFRDKNDREYMY